MMADYPDGYPTNHQELFDAFVYAEHKIISEWSSAIDAEDADLDRWAATYAAQNGLTYGEES